MAKRKASEWAPIGEAAESAGIARNTVWRWVKAGKLASKPGPPVRNLVTTLVDLRALQALVGAGVSPGRPRKSKGE